MKQKKPIAYWLLAFKQITYNQSRKNPTTFSCHPELVCAEFIEAFQGLVQMGVDAEPSSA